MLDLKKQEHDLVFCLFVQAARQPQVMLTPIRVTALFIALYLAAQSRAADSGEYLQVHAAPPLPRQRPRLPISSGQTWHIQYIIKTLVAYE